MLKDKGRKNNRGVLKVIGAIHVDCKHNTNIVILLMFAAPHANSAKQNTQGMQVFYLLSQTYSASYHASSTATSNGKVPQQGFQ